MKQITRSILLFLGAFAASAAYAGQPGAGLAGVDVFVKQNPSKRAVTDARGNFALDALPAGSYALTFRARKAADVKTTTTTRVVVAATYSVKVEGTKRSVNQSGLTSDNLVGGFEIPVQVAAGAKIRGQVLAGATKKMIWISKEPGSNIPGRWVDEDSPEGKAAFHSNAYGMSGEGMRKMVERAADQPLPKGGM